MWLAQPISYIMKELENPLTQFLENIFIYTGISCLSSIQIIKWLTLLSALSMYFPKTSGIVSVIGFKST